MFAYHMRLKSGVAFGLVGTEFASELWLLTTLVAQVPVEVIFAAVVAITS